jgi:glycosyltransferase involved in cell wall biosynthesis
VTGKQGMLNVLIEADFSLDRTGIQSTASSILRHFPVDRWRLYSTQDITIAGKPAQRLPIPAESIGLIFSHMEYTGLPKLLRQNRGVLAHVGDWPGNYWETVRRNQSLIRGTLGACRSWARILKVPRASQLLLVTDQDTDAAREQGFRHARTLHIGVNPPTVALAPEFQPNALCFTGSFRYIPNREAAVALANWADRHPQFHVHLAGFFASELSDLAGSRVFLHNAVSSMPDFLAQLRPVYVSLIRTGAGAKNKILEALAAGCPILATEESLDETTRTLPNIHRVSNTTDLLKQLSELAHQQVQVNADAIRLAREVRANRSWQSVASQLADMLRMPIDIDDAYPKHAHLSRPTP